MARSLAAATVLLALGTVLWVGLTYTIFTALTIKRNNLHCKKVSPERGSSQWLQPSGSPSSPPWLHASGRDPLQLEGSISSRLRSGRRGGILYIWIISLIFYRETFFTFSPGDLTPPYWINMGAMAISTLAGTQLVQNAPDAPFLAVLLPFLNGLTVFYWATGTWWIPMLLVLTIWQHLIWRFPLRYDPLYWGAVFPLGMYAVATRQMAATLQLPFLAPLPAAVFVAALAAWTLAFTALAWQIMRELARRRR